MTIRPSTFAALSALDDELARGQAAAGITRDPVALAVPVVPSWAFDALVADLRAIHAEGEAYAHDRWSDQ